MCALSSKIQGTLSTQPAFLYRGEFEVKDLKNKFSAKVNFIETKAKSALGGFFGKKEDKAPRNQVEIKIVKVKDGVEMPLLLGSGNYLRAVQFEGQTIWTVHDKVQEFASEDALGSLPSSSARRVELGLIVQKRFEEADKIVEKRETAELNDEKARKKTAKELYKK